MQKAYTVTLSSLQAEYNNMEEVHELNVLLAQGYQIKSVTGAGCHDRAMFLVVMEEPAKPPKTSYA